ncbi:hypothetical protein DFJ43DRAFT_1041031 [Lentinula guzmanii]|uniref:Uncharacterized protein n=1 Tax=Lentinula guzmanii TaxID=2804957 RepID=A0AA38JMW5_9AGAR|nr:hypothetical protein DFJ43DRAFT_1041031 [Lentinula guzmanii]
MSPASEPFLSSLSSLSSPSDPEAEDAVEYPAKDPNTAGDRSITSLLKIAFKQSLKRYNLEVKFLGGSWKSFRNAITTNGGASDTQTNQVWFIAFAFVIAQIGTNISANSNIRRGGHIADILHSPLEAFGEQEWFCIIPFCVFGLLELDCWGHGHRVWKGHYRMKDLYDTRRDGWYWYTYGINFSWYFDQRRWIGSDGSDRPSRPTQIYEMSFFTGFGTSMVIYLLLNWAFPVPGGIGEKSASFEEVDISSVWDSAGHGQAKGSDSESGTGNAELDEVGDGSYSLSVYGSKYDGSDNYSLILRTGTVNLNASPSLLHPPSRQ